jgi:hypothetical protein
MQDGNDNPLWINVPQATTIDSVDIGRTLLQWIVGFQYVLLKAVLQ